MKERAAGLPSHEFVIHSGIITGFRYEDINVNGLAQAVNVDPAATYRAVGKVPGSTLLSDAHGSSVESIHYLEAFDLTATLQRLVFTLAGGTLYSLNTTSLALTSLASGFTSEAMASIVYNDRLHLASPNNDPKKVDVAGQVSNWGVKAPGETETALESFASEANFSINGSNTKATSTSTPPNFPNATSSVQVNKVDTSVTSVQLTRSGLSLNLATAGQDTAYILLFLPAGSLAKLATSGSAVDVTFGNSGLTAADSHSFEVGGVQEGWNAIPIDTSTPSSQTGAGATLSSIDTIRFTLTLSAVGTTQSGFLWSYFFTYDEGAPTVAIGAAGSVTGQKSYVVTFLSRYGQESNAGPSSETVVADGDAVSLTSVPVSSDSQVIARRIYRDDATDGVYRFVDQIDNNVDTTFTDDVANADLSTTGAPLAGDPDDDNSIPPRFRDIALFRNHVFGIVEDIPNTVRISDVAEPESFPTTNELTFDEELTGLELWGEALLVYGTDRAWVITGSTMEDFFVQQANPEIGCAGRRAHVVAKGVAPFIWHDDGPWMAINPVDPWFVGAPIQDQIKDLDTTQFANIFMVHDRRRFRVIMFIPGSSTTTQKIWVWSYGKKSVGTLSGEGAGLDPTEIRTGGWFELSLPSVPRCAVIAETTADQADVLIGCTDGRVYRLQDTDATNYASGAASAAISMTLETLDVPLSSDRDGRGTPRYLAVNGEFNQETVLTFTVSTRNDANGKVLQTRSWSTTFSAGQQSKVIAIPAPGLKGSYARVKVENNRVNEVPVITSLRLYLIPGRTFTGTR